MRDLTEFEMMQTQGGFAYEKPALQALGISREALSGIGDNKPLPCITPPAPTLEILPEQTSTTDHPVWRALADTQRDIWQSERGRPFRQGAFRSRFLNR